MLLKCNTINYINISIEKLKILDMLKLYSKNLSKICFYENCNYFLLLYDHHAEGIVTAKLARALQKLGIRLQFSANSEPKVY